MKIETFASRSAATARITLGPNPEAKIIGTLPDGTHLAVFFGRPSDAQFSYYQLFTSSIRHSRVRPGEQIYGGSQSAIRHPSVDHYYGTDEQGKGTRGPWSIMFQDVGRIAFPAQLSSDNPQLITSRAVSAYGTSRLAIQQTEIIAYR